MWWNRVLAAEWSICVDRMTNRYFHVIENEWMVLKDGTRLAARIWMPEPAFGGLRWSLCTTAGLSHSYRPHPGRDAAPTSCDGRLGQSQACLRPGRFHLP
ncbi:hypothetical protein FJ945_20445 [Mesorhizobium sp. B2-4-9]|nr:hypothetical protein FJ945_20445 [Mesorhizobium sp. B2-4-9]